MHEAHGLPLRHQRRRAAGDFFQQGLIRVLFRQQFRIELFEYGIGQNLQFIEALVVIPVLERTEADEAGGHAGDDGGGFRGFAHDALVRADYGQGARGRDAERGHGFRTEEFADRGAQHGTAITHARIGGHARALELQLDASLAVGGRQVAQGDGAAIAELAGPDAELVSGIDRRQRRRTGRDQVAGEDVEEAEVLIGRPWQPGRGRGCLAESDQVGRGQGRGLQPGIEGRRQFGETVPERGQRIGLRHGQPVARSPDRAAIRYFDREARIP